MKSIIIISKQPVFSLGLRTIALELYKDANIQEAYSKEDAINILKNNEFDLCIFDTSLLGERWSVFIGEITADFPNLKVLVSIHNETKSSKIISLIKGARGILNAHSDSSQVKIAISEIIENRFFAEASIVDFLIENPTNNPLEKLTKREYKIAERFVANVSIKKIAMELNLKTSTISTYKLIIFRKLSIDNIFQLIELFDCFSKVPES